MFSNRGKRSSMFRNEWVWNFFREGVPCLVTGTIGVPRFVMNTCGIFFR